MLKKALSIVLSLLICFGAMAVMPVAASAEEVDSVDAVEAQNTIVDTAVTKENSPSISSDADLADTGASADIADKKASGYALAAPVITKLKSTTAGVSVTWKKVPGAAKYRVYLKTSSGWKKLCDTTSLSYIYTKVSSGTKYFFSVRCLSADAKKFTSDMNTTGWAITYFATPKIKSLVNKTNGVRITWSKVNKAARYRVFLFTSSGLTKLGESTTTVFTHKTAKSGTKYKYTVCCITKDGRKTVSAYNTKGWAITRFETPKITKLTSTTSGVKITWKKVSKAPYYCVFVKNGKSWKKIGVTKSNTFVHKGTKSSTKYYYTVRCLSANRKKFISDYSAKGWYITYKKPANWRTLYKSFILNKKYLKMKTKILGFFDSSYNTQNEENIKFSFHDLDGDKIPELIAHSYSAGYMLLQYHFYTIKNNKVVYLDTLALCGDGIFLSTVSGYNGLFNYGGDEGYHTARYVSMKGGKIEYEIVKYDYPTREEIKNQKLYQVMNKSRKNYSISYLDGKKPLYQYSYSQIKSMGWNAFLKKYGF